MTTAFVLKCRSCGRRITVFIHDRECPHCDNALPWLNFDETYEKQEEHLTDNDTSLGDITD